MKADNILYKTIGFLNLTNDEIKSITKDFTPFLLSSDDQKFLDQTYHSEYLNIMFDKKNVERFYRDLNFNIQIENISTKLIVSKVELFIFHEEEEKEYRAIFSLSYILDNVTIENLSDVSNALNKYNQQIFFEDDKYTLKNFISEKILNNKKFFEENTPCEQYAGSKFKNYLVIDLKHEKKDRDELLYEIGTCSKIGTIKKNDLYSPSQTYQKQILENKISCFNNYDALCILDSFTVIGSENYNKELYTHKTWDEVYFSIYIFNLYMKCSLQILSNDFSSSPMKRRRTFQNFYNKYFFNKISFNFLPNEIHKGIKNGLEIQDDLDFISDRLETLAVQINEKQQKQQESLLLVISIIALLETPLHLDGIRNIIGIDNIVVYNSIVYFLLIVTIISFLYIKIKQNR